MNVKTIEFTLLYGHDCRIRHYHKLNKNKIIEFCLQLEIYFEKRWYPVVRYDTAHGFAHKDTLHKNGRINKEPLFLKDFNEALTFAETDVRTNLEIYRERFLKEANSNG